MLIHIGYQKTATKWLRDKVFGQPKTGFGLLTQHIPAIRELAFGDPLVFDAETTRAALAPKLAELEQAGLAPALSWGRLVGVAFSGGHDTKPIADNLAQTFPGARIVVVMREQRSMVVSTYKQYVKTGGPARLETFLWPDSQHKAPTFRFEFFEYDRVIRYYRSLFGADAVLAMPYEQLAGDRAGSSRRWPSSAAGRWTRTSSGASSSRALATPRSRPSSSASPVRSTSCRRRPS